MVYIEALAARIDGERLESARIVSLFLVRTVEPPIGSVEGRRVAGPAADRQAHRHRLRGRHLDRPSPDDRRPAALGAAGRRDTGRKARRAGGLRLRERHAYADRGGVAEAGVAARRPRRGGARRAGSWRPRGARDRSRRVPRFASAGEPHSEGGRSPTRGCSAASATPIPTRSCTAHGCRPSPRPKSSRPKRSRGCTPRRAAPWPNGPIGCARNPAPNFPRASPRSAPRWRSTAATSSLVPSAAQPSSAFATLPPRPTIARAARPAGGCSPTARCRAC